jgi:hypothetical protein
MYRSAVHVSAKRSMAKGFRWVKSSRQHHCRMGDVLVEHAL